MMRFSEIVAETPTLDGLNHRYAELDRMLDRGGAVARAEAWTAWDAIRREVETWNNLTQLRFEQNTRDHEAKAARDYADQIMPQITALDIALKNRFLADPDRAGVEDLVGRHAVRLWECDVTTFEPAITSDLEEEAKLSARYTEILAGASLTINGKTVNLAGIEPFAQDLDRATRHQAEQARWAFFEQHGETLDQVFDDLVKLRHGMAQKLSYETYTPLGYRRMRRVDYGPADVARYRDAVARDVVPLVADLNREQARAMGVDHLCYWDESLIDLAGNPKPAGDVALMIDRAKTLFDRMGPQLGGFFRMMADGGFLDLPNRAGKAGGGFCTSFPAYGVPYIFANFNGTNHDVTVFTHEVGHAFQNWESRMQPGIDLLWPTYEAAEINSMGLEFLTHPHIDLLVAPGEADRFRRLHLISSLAFLPYGVAVDHFQHEVYANPEATPAERHAMWQRLEQRYMPWRDYGDLNYPGKGGLWQAKRHIFLSPFYYIDYTLALCCAMQLWARALKDYDGALAAYTTLCGRGGSAPFQDLVAQTGLVSPFSEGALSTVVAVAKDRLGVSA